MAFDNVRTFCPFCGVSWQIIKTVKGETYFVHSCKERSHAWVAWGLDGLPFIAPEGWFEW